MEKYLRMSDYFNTSHQMNVQKLTADDELYCGDSFVAEFTGSGQAIAAAHAINSHDELVAMNKELLAALEAVIEWYDMEADHSIEPDFYKRMAACQASEDMAREAIAKAKAAS